MGVDCGLDHGEAPCKLRCLVEPAFTSLSSACCFHPLHREQRSLAWIDHYSLPHRHLVLSPSTLHHHPLPLPTGCCSCAYNRPLSICRVPPPSALKRLPAPKVQWRLIRDLFKFNLISSSPSLRERHRRYLRDLCPYFRT